MQGIEQIQAELQKLSSEPSPLNTAKAKLVEYAQDQEKLQRVIESLQVPQPPAQGSTIPCTEHPARWCNWHAPL